MRPGSINCASSVFNRSTKSGLANAHAPTRSTSARFASMSVSIFSRGRSERFTRKAFGQTPQSSILCTKYSHGMPTWIKDRDVKLIAKEYNKRNGKKLKFI